MAKSKEKTPKGEVPGEKNGNGNPFESNEDEAHENQEYPTEINPFMKKPTKSMKKAEKKEKKRAKKEQKQKKKEPNGDNRKKQKEQIVVSGTQLDGKGELKNNGMHYPSSTPANESSTLPPIRTPEYDLPPSQERKVSQTLDVRSEKSPPLNNKRILELKTGKESSRKPTHKPPSYATNQSKSQPSPRVKRPNSLGVPSKPSGVNRGLSPVREHSSPSPLAGRPHPHPGGNEEIKMYRSASISKKGKDKKKKKKMKKMFKKKKGKKANLLEDQDLVDQVVMRHPQKNRLEQLQKEVDETTESIRSSVICLVEQRNQELDKMVLGTKELEEKSHGFATVAQEARLKKQSSATCCGMWKKWRVCWYICACQTGVKKKKKWEEVSKNNKDGAQDAHELLSRYSRAIPDDEDDDDYYRAVDKSLPSPKPRLTTAQINPRPLSNYSNSNDSVDAGTASLLRSKVGTIPKEVRASLPNLADSTPPLRASIRKMEQNNPRMRRSSSVGDIQEIAKTRAEKRREEKGKKRREKERTKRQKDIKEFASQYDNEETRTRVEDLLSLDLDSPGD